MAKKDKEVSASEIYDERQENMDGGAFDNYLEDTDGSESYNNSIFFSPGRHARTFSLPLEDVTYSKLLGFEKDGKASIFNKQYCPCPKEGTILVLCEYDIYF